MPLPGHHLNFADLHLNPIALSIGPLDIRWYSLAYIAGILLGWWYMLKLLAQAEAPMERRQADDLIFYATLGVIVGGRLGYAIFAVATLSFIGFGIQPPSPDWGLSMADNYGLINGGYWWPTLFPAMAIASLVVGVNLLADGIGEVLER